MSAFCSRTKPTHSYYVTMIDYGNRGCEAIVDPEITYSGVVARVRTGEYKDIIFVHHIDDGVFDDVTECVLYDASRETVSA